MAAPIGQNNWRYCAKCFGLWYNGNPTNGVCPAGGAHDGGSVSWDYVLVADPVPIGQPEIARAGEASAAQTPTAGKPGYSR